jgi:hypothetical protein
VLDQIEPLGRGVFAVGDKDDRLIVRAIKLIDAPLMKIIDGLSSKRRAA